MAFMLVVNHHRLFHLRVRSQCAFNFPQLNAVAADLDLKIIASPIFQIAVRPPAYQVAGFIQAGVTPRLIFRRGKRVHHKTLGSQRRLVPVSAGQPRAPDIQFPRRPDRGQVTLTIKDIQSGVINSLTDRPIPVP